jgi:hypothetical protein
MPKGYVPLTKVINGVLVMQAATKLSKDILWHHYQVHCVRNFIDWQNLGVIMAICTRGTATGPLRLILCFCT